MPGGSQEDWVGVGIVDELADILSTGEQGFSILLRIKDLENVSCGGILLLSDLTIG